MGAGVRRGVGGDEGGTRKCWRKNRAAPDLPHPFRFYSLSVVESKSPTHTFFHITNQSLIHIHAITSSASAPSSHTQGRQAEFFTKSYLFSFTLRNQHKFLPQNRMLPLRKEMQVYLTQLKGRPCSAGETREPASWAACPPGGPPLEALFACG